MLADNVAYFFTDADSITLETIFDCGYMAPITLPRHPRRAEEECNHFRPAATWPLGTPAKASPARGGEMQSIFNRRLHGPGTLAKESPARGGGMRTIFGWPATWPRDPCQGAPGARWRDANHFRAADYIPGAPAKAPPARGGEMQTIRDGEGLFAERPASLTERYEPGQIFGGARRPFRALCKFRDNPGLREALALGWYVWPLRGRRPAPFQGIMQIPGITQGFAKRSLWAGMFGPFGAGARHRRLCPGARSAWSPGRASLVKPRVRLCEP
jgi:hypothetical protein